MELTKQQVENIDQYLRENGVKYWDIRIDMLDHIVTDIEIRIENRETFETAKENSLSAMGWKGNLSGITREQLQNINKKVRTQYFREFWKIFVNLKAILIITISVLALYLLYSNIDYKSSKTMSATIYLTPSVITITYMFFSILFKKSAYIQYGTFYMTFPFFMLNFILMLIKDTSWISEEMDKWIYLAVAVVNSLFVYAGIKNYLQLQKSVSNIQKQLCLL